MGESLFNVRRQFTSHYTGSSPWQFRELMVFFSTCRCDRSEALHAGAAGAAGKGAGAATRTCALFTFFARPLTEDPVGASFVCCEGLRRSPLQALAPSGFDPSIASTLLFAERTSDAKAQHPSRRG